MVKHRFYGFQTKTFNEPLPIAGVYLITNLISSKHYVGVAYGENGVARRGRMHTYGSTKLLGMAIKKYGIDSFLFEPIYYLLPAKVPTEADLAFLFNVEREMIAAYRGVSPGGYNISSGGVYPSGEVFRQAIMDAWSDPKKKAERIAKIRASGGPEKNGASQRKLYEDQLYRERVKAAQDVGRDRPEVVAARVKVLNDPQTRKAQQAAMTPEVREKQRLGLKAAYVKDPTIADRISSSVSALHDDPAYREIYLAGRVKAAPKISASLTGRSLSEDHKENVKKGMQKLWEELPRVWITDGTNNQRILEGSPMPDGWMTGRIFKNIWITNGTSNKRIGSDDPMPEGWRFGRSKPVETVD